MDIFKFQVFCVLVLLQLPVHAQIDKIDSLKKAIETHGEDSLKVDALISLSRALMGISLEEAIEVGVEANTLATKLNYRKGKALALKNIGLGYYHQSDYLQVFDFWENSLLIYRTLGDQAGIANLKSNLGAIYFNQGDDAKAIEYYLGSIKAAESISDSIGIGRASIGIGNVYLNKKENFEEAKNHYSRALDIFEHFEYGDGIGTCAVNLGNIYLEQSIYDTALTYLEKSTSAFENEVYVPHSLNLIGQLYTKTHDYTKATKYLEEAVELAKDLNLKMEVAQAMLGLAEVHEQKGDISKALSVYKDVEQIAKEIGANYELKDSFYGIAQSYSQLSDYKNAFRFMEFYDAIKDTLYSIETDEKIKGLHFTYQMQNKQNEVDLLTKEKSIQQLEIRRQEQAKYSYLAGAIFLLLIAFITYRSYRRKVKTNQLLDDQNAEIEKLILNILPAETAKELQNDGYATPRYYESVSVLFTDFKDFTKIAEGLKPHELIAELNSFFNAFDDIVEKFHLEKIKTIGDSYMCAGGLPVANKTHPIRIVKAGLAMQKFMMDKNKQRIQQGMQPWGLRIGIHTGSIVAGVVGKKKYAYDIWGDTVNIASRMESNGEVNKVNISAATYELVKDIFTFTHRGKIEAKNKGFIDMYFLEKELQEKDQIQEKSRI